MINLLRADFYKLFHTKILYICTFILLCYVGITATALSYIDHLPEDKRAMFEQNTAENSETGVSLTMSDDVDFSQTYLQSGTQLASEVVQEGSIIILVIGIMVAIMIGSEFKERTIKSMVAKGYRRDNIVISKMIVSIVSITIMMACVVIGSLIIGGVLSGNINNFTSAELTDQVRCFAGILMAYLSFAAVYTVSVFVIRNVEFSLVANILILVALPNVLNMIESTWKIPFSKIQITVASSQVIHTNASTAALIHMGILFVGYVIISTVISCIIFRKADVK